MIYRSFASIAVVQFLIFGTMVSAGEPWKRHVIDDTSRGADGVRLADVNGDGRMDVATGWEEGGLVRVYLQPETAKVTEPWPKITVGRVRSPEDAVFCDVNGDGRMDVVSSCEGKTRTMFVHLAPAEPHSYDDESAWRTKPFPAVEKQAMWMFALPMELSGDDAEDVVMGAKGPQASIGWLESPADPADLSAWTYHPLRPAGWIMTLRDVDMNGDGRRDILFSDRKGKRNGVNWLEQPPRGSVRQPWTEHYIGSRGIDPMFIDIGDLDGDGRRDVAVPTWTTEMLILYGEDDLGQKWTETRISLPEKMQFGKAARIGDLDGDGHADIALTMRGPAEESGVRWLRGDGTRSGDWEMHDISGPPGTKFDRIELLDLDGDGDLDLMTCEEVHNLGVIWYENPAQRPDGNRP